MYNDLFEIVFEKMHEKHPELNKQIARMVVLRTEKYKMLSSKQHKRNYVETSIEDALNALGFRKNDPTRHLYKMLAGSYNGSLAGYRKRIRENKPIDKSLLSNNQWVWDF